MGDLNLIIEPDEEEAEAASVYVDGKIDGKPYRFLLDTGAARSGVILDDHTSTYNSIGTRNSSGIFASAGEDLIVVGQIEIGPIARQNLTVTRSTDTARPVNLIGMDVLHDF